MIYLDIPGDLSGGVHDLIMLEAKLDGYDG
jgi:hypothetical protein